MKLSKFDAVGVHLKYFLEDDGEWHDGMVEEYHPRRGYHIQLFDGHDVWINTLDENVRFEDELGTGGTETFNGKTMDTQMSFHEDELLLQDAEDVLHAEDAMDNQFQELNVPDYRSHQEYNQTAIRADLPTLPARGILLSGSVLGAAGLVTDAGDAMDGEVFFKVLFVEGGSQPAMFRCKTPIYTSEPVARSLSNPAWDNGRFQFDMIMPVDPVGDLKSRYGFKIQGEIIIAVYMSRSSGGNSFLGQASFQLKDIVDTGTVEFFSAGYEGRSVTGAHTILSRAGEVSGEVDVQLNLAWKSLNAGLGPSTAVSQSKLAGLPPRPASASATATRAASAARGGGASNKGRSAGASGRDGSAPRQRPASALNKGTMPPPRKIVSNIQRKQREDAARIAKENQKLQHTLHLHANRGGRPAAAPITTAYATAAPTLPAAAATAGARPTSASATTRTHALSMAADVKETADAREHKASGRAAASAKASSDAQLVDGLLRILTELKRSTALDEQENVRLKLKVGKLKVSVKQAEMTVDRIRSESGGDTGSKSGPGAMRTSLRSSGELPRRSRDGQLQADPKDALPSARSQLSTARVDRARQGEHEYVPFFEPLTDAELAAQGVHDGEYKSLAEEYNVLQSVRRGLLDRITAAKKACDTAGEKQQSATERMDMIRRRVDYYRDIAGKLAIGVQLQLEGGSVGAKRAQVEDDGSHPDFVLFDRLREGKQEYVTECAIFEAGMHTIAQENALTELRAVRDLLASKSATLEAEVRGLKEDNDEFHRQLRSAMGEHRELGLDAYVQRLRLQRGRHGRKGSLAAEAEERLKAASDGLAAVDRQLKGVKERQGERRQSRSAAVPDEEVV